MDGIVLINKEKGVTSRFVVNQVCEKLKTKHVGHTGTLDPIAEGLMVICVNEGCKLVELLTHKDKDYVAKVRVGIQTDTYDITGKILLEKKDYLLKKEKLLCVLNHFNGEYLQEVPKYSSIKVNGKKLYEYARDNTFVELPKHMVKISNMKLLEFEKNTFTFSVTVSSGTYIRSLINDIGKELGIPMTMEELKRTRVGDFYLKDATNVSGLKIISLIDAIDLPKIEVDDNLLKQITNGAKIKNIYHEKMVCFVKNNKLLAIYQEDKDIMRSYRIFRCE